MPHSVEYAQSQTAYLSPVDLAIARTEQKIFETREAFLGEDALRLGFCNRRFGKIKFGRQKPIFQLGPAMEMSLASPQCTCFVSDTCVAAVPHCHS